MDWNAFKNGEIAVHVNTHQEYDNFVNQCEKHGFCWNDMEVKISTDIYQVCGSETCVRFEPIVGYLRYCSREDYRKFFDGVKIVEYKDFVEKETVTSLEKCLSNDDCKGCPLQEDADCCNTLKENALRLIKEKEPAPSANGTSPNENILHIDDTTLLDICQVLSSAMSTILGLYQQIPEEDQKAFDLGTAYKDICFASAELEKFKSNKED